MKASWRERFWFWFCDTFGHARPDSRSAAWEHNGQRHHHCMRCRRVASKPIT